MAYLDAVPVKPGVVAARSSQSVDGSSGFNSLQAHRTRRVGSAVKRQSVADRHVLGGSVVKAVCPKRGYNTALLHRRHASEIMTNPQQTHNYMWYVHSETDRSNKHSYEICHNDHIKETRTKDVGNILSNSEIQTPTHILKT